MSKNSSSEVIGEILINQGSGASITAESFQSRDDAKMYYDICLTRADGSRVLLERISDTDMNGDAK